MNRTTEFILGLIGGIIGFGSAFFALFVGLWNEDISNLGTFALLFSLLAIVGSIVVKFKNNLGGWMMLISGVGILVSISLFGLLPAILLIPAGLMGILRKQKVNHLKSEV